MPADGRWDLTQSLKVNVPPDDGVTAPKNVGAVLMSILIFFLRQLTSASVGE
jgi:hypothetical protein